MVLNIPSQWGFWSHIVTGMQIISDKKWKKLMSRKNIVQSVSLADQKVWLLNYKKKTAEMAFFQ